MSTVPNGQFRTSDLYFAAFLRTAGAPMVDQEKDGRRVIFVFDGATVSVQELKKGYFNGTAQVPAQDYANNIKSLKSLCHGVL